MPAPALCSEFVVSPLAAGKVGKGGDQGLGRLPQRGSLAGLQYSLHKVCLNDRLVVFA